MSCPLARVPALVASILLLTTGAIAQTRGLLVADRPGLDSALLLFDADQDVMTGRFPPTGETPPWSGCTLADVVITRDGRTGIVSDRNGDRLWVFDLSEPVPRLAPGPNPIPLLVEPGPLALSPDDRFLLVQGTHGGGFKVDPISIVDVEARAEIGFHFLSGGFTRGPLAIGADASVLTREDSSTTNVVRGELTPSGLLRNTLDTFDPQALRPPGGDPAAPVVEPRGVFAVVPTYGGGALFHTLRVEGLEHLARVRLIEPVSGADWEAWQGLFGPRGRTLYLWAETWTRSAAVLGFHFDPRSGLPDTLPFLRIDIPWVPGGVRPEIAIHPDGSKLYVPRPGSLSTLEKGALDVYDARSGVRLTSLTGLRVHLPYLAVGGEPERRPRSGRPGATPPARR